MISVDSFISIIGLCLTSLSVGFGIGYYIGYLIGKKG